MAPKTNNTTSKSTVTKGFSSNGRQTSANSNNISPTFEKLFGDEDYHEVNFDRSIFSPAAYFVDLWSTANKYITPPGGKSVNDVITARRIDLVKELQLNVYNTTTEVPKLDIVNVVLTDTLKKALNIPEKGSLDLTSYSYPFNLPYDRAQTTLKTYLEKNNINLLNLCKTLSISGSPVVHKFLDKDLLNINDSQWDIISNMKPGTKLYTYYGYQVPKIPPKGYTDLVTNLADISTFLSRTDLTLDELMELLFQNLSDKELHKKEDSAGRVGLNKAFYINDTGDGESLDIKYIDDKPLRISNLTKERLIRINQFVRLAKTISWSFTDLDWALRTIGNIKGLGNGKPVINDQILPYLAWMYLLKKEQGLSINQCCALIGSIKDQGLKNGPNSTFFDQIFNNKQLPTLPGKWSATTWFVPQIGAEDTNAKNQKITNTLAAALQISISDLIEIGNQLLNKHIPMPPNGIVLDNNVLSILYRVSLLPKLTQLSISELFVAAKLIDPKTKTDFENLFNPDGGIAKHAIVQTTLISEWIRKTPISVFRMQFILTGASNDTSIENSIISSDAVANFVISLKSSSDSLLLTEPKFQQSLIGQVQQEFQAMLAKAIEEQKKVPIPIIPPKSKIVVFNPLNNLLNAQKQTKLYAEQVCKQLYTYFQKNGLIVNGIVYNKNETINQHTEQIKIAYGTAFKDALNDARNGIAPGSKKVSSRALKQVPLHLSITPLLPANIQQVISVLLEAYSAQQKNLANQLAALYNISPKIATVVKIWGDLNIESIIDDSLPQQNQKTRKKELSNNGKANKYASVLGLIYTTDQSALLVNSLKRLQQAAFLVTDLNLSAAEATFFKRDYKPTKIYPIKKEAVKIICDFRKLVTTYNDTQNNLLNILQGDAKKPQKSLANLTGWNEQDIHFLQLKLNTPIPTSSSKKPIPLQAPYDVETITIMQGYFSYADTLAVSVQLLWNLANSPNDNLETNATALLAGLSKQLGYTEVQNIQTELAATLRDHLVPLTLYKKDIATPRALYEYLLLDVEVGTEVVTSKIKEAISALQLYIYRCLNNLETGTIVDASLPQLWTWMYGYRDWQANREVFLFPENYIQPELRQDKTNLFAKLEADLKQANLSDPSEINAVFNTYMNGFADIAQLSIVGSSGRDLVQDDMPTKEICFVGTNGKTGNTYYYRVATFVKPENADSYQPVSWGQWQKVSTQIKPYTDGGYTGTVNPVFAFGKWYLFWVEKQVVSVAGPAKQPSSGVPPAASHKQNNAVIKYSCLNFNKQWGAAQEFWSEKYEASKSSVIDNLSLYPIYFNSKKVIVLPYSGKAFLFSEQAQANPILYAYKYSSTYPIDQKGTLNNLFKKATKPDLPQFQYFPPISILGSFVGALPAAFTTWFKIGLTTRLNLCGDLQAQAGVGFFIGNSTKPVLKSDKLKLNQWWFIAFSDGKYYIYLDGELLVIDTTVEYNAFVGTGNGVYAQGYGVWQLTQGLPNNITVTDFITFKNNTYAGTAGNGIWMLNKNVWQKVSKSIPDNAVVNCFFSNGHELVIGTKSNGLWVFDGTNWEQVKQLPHNATILQFQVFNNNLHVATDGQGTYHHVSNKVGWQLMGVPFDTTTTATCFYSTLPKGNKANKQVNIIGTKSNGLYIQIGRSAWRKVKYSNGNEHISCINYNPKIERFAAGTRAGQVIYFNLKGEDGWKNTVAKGIPIQFIDNTVLDKNPVYCGLQMGGVKYLHDHPILGHTWETAKGLPKNTTTFSAIEHNNKQYLVTNNGLYVSKDIIHGWTKMKAKITGETSFKVIGSDLYAASMESGLYKLASGSSEWEKIDEVRSLQINTISNQHSFLGSNETSGFPTIHASLYLSTQETLVYQNSIEETEVQEIYQNSNGFLTQDLEIFEKASSAFGAPPDQQPITMLPNWRVFSKNKAQYLGQWYPFPVTTNPALQCYRLNTTATNKLSELLHTPNGVNALMSTAAQRTNEIPFGQLEPNNILSIPFNQDLPIPESGFPLDQIDFSLNSAMSNYYWEVFFHAPFLVSNELKSQQQFATARTWLQYIFNPSQPLDPSVPIHLNDSSNERYWRFLGLREANNEALRKDYKGTLKQEQIYNLNNALEQFEYESEPFDPQAIAALRPIAYQKTIATHYIDNLMQWGDMLFIENSRESIVEAEMFYVAAYDLLGNKPDDLGKAHLAKPTVFENLDTKLFRCKAWASDFDKAFPNGVTFICYNGDTLYASDGFDIKWTNDNGRNWASLKKTQPSLKIDAITNLYCSEQTVYAGILTLSKTGSGVFTTTNTEKPFTKLFGPGIINIPSLISETNDYLFVGEFEVTIGATGIKPHNTLYRSDDGGSTFAQQTFSPPLSVTGILTGIAATATSQFAGSLDGLYKYDDVTKTWVAINNWWVLCIEETNGILYVGTLMGLHMSNDNGASWYQVPLSLTTEILVLRELPIFSIAIASEAIYVGTMFGLWRSFDGGTAWQRVSELPFWPILKVYAANDTIYAGSMIAPHSGFWVGDPYFGIPRNDQFLSYWDTVKQRLYNIRHSLDINGNPDVLPLFQPPINPMALVAALASGESVAEATHSQTLVVPYYRFTVIIERARSITQTVIQLGQALLSALEKKDAEALANLNNVNQQNILHLTQQSKAEAYIAAGQELISLQASLKGAQDRLAHYSKLISGGISATEQKQIDLQAEGIAIQVDVAIIRAAAAIAAVIPSIYGFSDGGMQFGDAVSQGASIAESAGNILNSQSGLAGINAGFQRRAEDWALQYINAQNDFNQIQSQIVTAQIRQEMAQHDMSLLQTEISQGQKVANFYKRKFTNEQLYQWHIGQIGSLYHQAYQLALSTAQQAENAWKFEHYGRGESQGIAGFVKPSYWNNLYQGLLSGEALMLDLQRMEKSFFDRNSRRLEIEKTISLAQLDPKALQDLRTGNSCIFDISEIDFAFDFPGHYCRQIKTISVSIPTVIGPYQNIHASLIQLNSKMVITDNKTGQDAVTFLLTGKGSSNSAIVADIRPNEQVALSQGINDSGMFTLNFDDTRYLPFEGTGAISSWSLEIPPDTNDFDLANLTDVIITLKYTAIPGSEAYKNVVTKNRSKFSSNHSLLISQIPGWPAFVKSLDQPIKQQLNIPFVPNRLRANMDSFALSNFILYMNPAPTSGTKITLDIGDGSGKTQITFSVWKNNLAEGKINGKGNVKAVPTSWTLSGSSLAALKSGTSALNFNFEATPPSDQ